MIFEKIRVALPSMSPTFKKIALYILDNKQSIGFLSIYTFAREVEVSNATLVRFARSLGFEGYVDLKRRIQNEIQHRLNPYDKIALSEMDSLPREKQWHKLFQNEVNNLRKTFNDIDITSLEAIASKIDTAGKVFIAGYGLSAHVARMFEYSLRNSIDKDIVVLSGSVSDYACQLKTFNADDVLFLITFPPYSGEGMHVATVAREHGGTLVLFTDSASCPSFPMANIIVPCESNSILLANSYVGLIALLQIIVNIVYLDNKDTTVVKRGEAIEFERRGYELLLYNGVEQ